MFLCVSGSGTDFLEVSLLVQRKKDFKLWRDSAVKSNGAVTVHTTNGAESVDWRVYVLYSDGRSFPYRECIPFQRTLEAEDGPHYHRAISQPLRLLLLKTLLLLRVQDSMKPTACTRWQKASQLPAAVSAIQFRLSSSFQI